MKAILFLLAFIPFLLIGQQEVNDLTVKDSLVAKSGNNYVSLGTLSGIRCGGDATSWDDLMFPFTTGTTGGTGYPAFNSDSMYYSFVVDSTGVSKCSMYFIIQVAHKAKLGSILHPHIHFKQEGTGTPVFVVQYKMYDIGATTNKAYSKLVLSTPQGGTTDATHGIVNGGSIQLTGTSLSSVLICNVFLRTLASGTTSCKAWQFDLHYEIDSQGSNTEYRKE